MILYIFLVSDCEYKSDSAIVTNDGGTLSGRIPIESSENRIIDIQSTHSDSMECIQVVPSLSEDRIINVPCGSLNFTGVTSSELGAVPEEDEEIATSSTPSTVVRIEMILIQNILHTKEIYFIKHLNSIN